MRTTPSALGLAALTVASLALGSPLATAATILVNADITTSTTWTNVNEYVLQLPIYVTNGATLTIEPGTVVRGEPATGGGINDPGTLIISRGSKILAQGTAAAPVVFTDLNDDNIGGSPGTFPYNSKADTRAIVGQWGGVILLGYGYAANNTAAGPDPAREVQIEGLDAAGGKGLYGNCSAFLPGPFGRNCDDGDSGTMTYLIVRYGGFNLSPNNEINGITLGGVGRETDLDYLEVYQTKDDAMELFGGAVNFKHAALSNHGDDGVDYDEGWRGKAQFVYQIQNVPGTEVTDKGGEWDGGNVPDNSQPKALPTLANMTFVGLGALETTYNNHDRNTAAHLRDNGGGRIYNSAWLDFGGTTVCIEGGNGVAGSSTAAGTSGERSVTPYVVDGVYYLDPPSSFELEFQDDVFWCFGSDGLLGSSLTTVGHCSITTGQACTQNTECPGGETCVDGPARWGCDAGKRHHDNGLFTNAGLRNTKLGCLAPLPIRQLTRVSSGSPTTHDPVDFIDPRAVVGGPLETTVSKAVPAGGFFEFAPYKGAFRGTNWTNGWTTISRLGYTPGCDATNTAVPDEVTGLRFNTKTDMSWTAPGLPTPTSVEVFDVVRSTTKSTTMFSGATCIDPNGPDTAAIDTTSPSPGQVFYYAVRAGNSCGDGTLGWCFNCSGGNDIERTGAPSCP